MKPQTQTAKHTQGDLKVCDGALICPEVNNYGNFIVVNCERERNDEDNANLERLALCWNMHDQLVAQRNALLACLQEIELLAREPKRSHVANIIVVKAKAAIALCEPKEKEQYERTNSE